MRACLGGACSSCLGRCDPLRVLWWCQVLSRWGIDDRDEYDKEDAMAQATHAEKMRRRRMTAAGDGDDPTLAVETMQELPSPSSLSSAVHPSVESTFSAAAGTSVEGGHPTQAGGAADDTATEGGPSSSHQQLTKPEVSALV